MLEDLKKRVYEANLEIVKQGLVIYTWGNASGYDPEKELMVIKPSGVNYDTMRPKDMVVLDLDGNILEGSYKPSSDTPTHRYLYKQYPELWGIVHTHSQWATVFAQAQKSIPPLGTTHADYFYGTIPVTRPLTDDEINSHYEWNTGMVIREIFNGIKSNPLKIPGVLVGEHGPFAFGNSPGDAAHNAKVMEEVAKMAYYTSILSDGFKPMNKTLLDKHYLRKHGKNAYYGQK
jgi:L-ribulose-5-phosphate 4-epimerase